MLGGREHPRPLYNGVSWLKETEEEGTHEGDGSIDRNARPKLPATRPFPDLDARKVEDESERPDEENVEEPHEAKEEGHRHTRLVADSNLEEDHVECVGECGGEGKSVA